MRADTPGEFTDLLLWCGGCRDGGFADRLTPVLSHLLNETVRAFRSDGLALNGLST